MEGHEPSLFLLSHKRPFFCVCVPKSLNVLFGAYAVSLTDSWWMQSRFDLNFFCSTSLLSARELNFHNCQAARNFPFYACLNLCWISPHTNGINLNSSTRRKFLQLRCHLGLKSNLIKIVIDWSEARQTEFFLPSSEDPCKQVSDMSM